jgi:hypothetical protein
MPDFSVLGVLMKTLHQEMVTVYYLMLPVFFALSVVTAWFRSPAGGIEFMDALKRAVVSSILIAAFPDISRGIIFIADGITDKIDSVNSLDQVIRLAKEKADGYSFSPTSVLLQFNDLIIATLSFLSYIVLYLARYITVALYYFFWVFFTATAPLLILFSQFKSTEHIAMNLFKGMAEVASWKIVWAILGVMLTALNFSDIYRVDGNYLTLMVMNFIIAIAMLMTPMMVRSITGSGLTGMAQTLGTAAFASMVAAPARAMTVATATRRFANAGTDVVSKRVSQFRGLSGAKSNPNSDRANK